MERTLEIADAQAHDNCVRELTRMARRVISDRNTHLQHPSFLTKKDARAHLERLKGAVEFVNMTRGDTPDETRAVIAEAYDAAAKWL